MSGRAETESKFSHTIFKMSSQAPDWTQNLDSSVSDLVSFFTLSI